MIESELMKPREFRQACKEFMGEKKADYYWNKFEELESKNKKISFNLAGLLLGYIWAFYRKIYVQAALAMGSFFLGFYIILGQTGVSTFNVPIVIGNAMMIIPSIVMGFFGNWFYYRHVCASVEYAHTLPEAKKAKYYHDNGDDGSRVTLGIVFASVFIMVALFFSALG